MKRLTNSPLLPILVGMMPIVSSFSTNAYRLGWEQLWLPLLIGAFAGFCGWGLFWAIKETRKNASIVSSVCVLLVMIWTVFPQPIIPATVILISVIAATRFKLNKAMPIITIIVVVAIIVSIGQAFAKTIQASATPIQSEPAIVLDKDYQPDIYFIVPDRLTSPQGLRDTGDDPSSFVQQLEDMGFYVRDNGLSNDLQSRNHKQGDVTRTTRFIASVLNFSDTTDLDIAHNTAASKMWTPGIPMVLQANGYTYYHIGSWYMETMVSRVANYSYVYHDFGFLDYFTKDEFVTAIIDRSYLRYLNAFVLKQRNDDTNRARLWYQLDSVIDTTTKASPKFVFVHLIMPHPPFIFTADGQPQNTEGKSLQQLYLEQAQFTESYLLEMVKAIPKDAIVIIQADEGMNFDQNLEENEKLTDNQFEGVMTAWHIPNCNSQDLEGIRHTEILRFIVNRLIK